MYIYKKETYENVFEIIDSIFPDLRITTIGSMIEDDNLQYDAKTLLSIQNLDDNFFYDINLKKAYSQEEFFLLYNIKK